MIHTRTWDERKLLWSLVILKKQNTLIAILKIQKLQVFTVHEGQNITTSYKRDGMCRLTCGHAYSNVRK